MINATTRKALRKALDEDDPVAAVRHVFEIARSSRAKQIAASEVVRSSGFAAIDAGKWNAELDLKTWISQRDSHVRHTHEVLDGQTVGWLEDFISPSGAHGPAPGQLGRPEEDIGCRCFPVPSRPGTRRELTQGQAVQEFADQLRQPFEQDLEAAWVRVFNEQEKAALELLGAQHE
jgi:hypothetical protein